MALGIKKFRLSEWRGSGLTVNKKLSFCEDIESSIKVDEQVNSKKFSPYRIRSGKIYGPSTSSISEARRSFIQTSDSESDTADSVIESSEEEYHVSDLLPLDHFDHSLSPIRREKSTLVAPHSSPACFIRRRERTSTRVLPSNPEVNNRLTKSSKKRQIPIPLNLLL